MTPLDLFLQAVILGTATNVIRRNAENNGDNNDNNNEQSNTNNEGPESNEDTSSNGQTPAATPATNSTGSTASSTNSSTTNTANTAAKIPTAAPSPTSDVAKVYEVLAPMAGNYMNAQAEQIGQAQRSMGTLAGRTQGSTTSGLGNYTYNRLMRPQADAMRDKLLVQGYANQLNKLLSDAYNRAKRNYEGIGDGGNNGQKDKKNLWNGDIERNTSTRYMKLPNSYQYQDENGNWVTAKRSSVFTDEDWYRIYTAAKKKAADEGRGFKDGE